jgi:hypothetical protein
MRIIAQCLLPLLQRHFLLIKCVVDLGHQTHGPEGAQQVENLHGGKEGEDKGDGFFKEEIDDGAKNDDEDLRGNEAFAIDLPHGREL